MGNRQTNGRAGLWLKAAWWAAACTCSVVAGAETIRYHGFQMDDQHRLVIEEENGVVRVGLLERARHPGMTSLETLEGGGTGESYRLTELDTLIRARCEVLKPAAPNYLRNPGDRYRIAVEGVSVGLDYASVKEVAARYVRNAFLEEVGKIMDRTDGIQRDALWYAGPLILGLWNEAGRMPAHVTMTVEESSVGRTRGLDKGLKRRGLPVGVGPVGGAVPARPSVEDGRVVNAKQTGTP